METRKIKVLSTVGVSGTIETNVSTLAELKPLLEQKDINFDGMKLMVGETRNELSLDEATLPEGDFKLFLMPAKTKSGVSNLTAICYDIASLFSDLAEELEDKFGSTNSNTENRETEVVDPDVEELRKLARQSDQIADSWID